MAYFSSSRRGEIPELQDELNSLKSDKKREAIKKVIAAMTVAKDVSSLFPYVVKCIDTNEVEMKKLVYLYIINYAKTQPELAIMAVNSFRKDARNPTSPLIRALAVRTMGCIRVERITEYLCEPLKLSLSDEDPYVRKTAAICVAKLYDISPELVEDSDFFSCLAQGLSDGNALVLSNTVAAIAEISEMRGECIVQFTPQMISRILSALNECTEWGQVFILDFLVTYKPVSHREAESIIERVIPRLAHANPAVVTSSVKVIIKLLDLLTNEEHIRNYCKKLAPSLVTLLNADPEIQYVALRCINLVVQKRPSILEKEIRVFYCKYNDPIYVKMEKLEIIIRLADHRNIEQILAQLKDYATEADIDFIRKAVQAIGRCALKLERAVDRCVSYLIDLVKLRNSYLVQEVLIVMRDIFRKYPNRFELAIKEIFENVVELDDPEARSALIWILGEYAERIEDAAFQLKGMAENFIHEPLKVQLPLMTAAVKLFLKKPEEGEDVITHILRTATEECSNPDLRDRAFLYWRLLSTDPEATKKVVLCDRPVISDASYTFDTVLLDKLIEQLGTLASVYHKPFETKASKVKAVEKEEIEKEEIERDPVQSNFEVDLLGIGEEKGKRVVVPLQTALTAETLGSGLQQGLLVEVAFQRQENTLLNIKLTNHSDRVLRDFAIQFNVNYFGLTPAEALNVAEIGVGDSKLVVLPIANTGSPSTEGLSCPFIVQIAMKCNLDVFYFQAPCMLTALLESNGKLSKEEYKERWKGIEDANEFCHTLNNISPSYFEKNSLIVRLRENNIFFAAERVNKETDDEVVYSSCSVATEYILSEMILQKATQTVQISARTPNAQLASLYIQAVNFLLTAGS